MKELTKLVKLILVPCQADDLKPEHWLLLNPKKNVLHIPAAGGQYRRMIQYGYVPVKPYLVSDDEIKEKDLPCEVVMNDDHSEGRLRTIFEIYKGEFGEQLMIDDPKDPKRGYGFLLRNECLKIIATPDQIHGSQIIPFNDCIEYDLDLEYMNLILRMNGGGCKIQTEYAGAITENPDEIIAEIQAGKVKPKLVDGKVVIVI